MRTDHDDSTIFCLIYYHFFSGKERLICNATHNLDDCRCCTEHEYLASRHCTIESYTEYFYISIINGIHDNFVEISDFHKFLLDTVDIHIVDLFKRNTGNIRSFVCTFGLFFHVFRHGCCSVTKSLIFCKLCLICRNQFFTIFDIVNIIDCKTTAFLEEWAKDFSVDSLAGIFLIICFQKFCFQWIMTAQSGVASADKNVFSAGFLGNLIYNFSNRIVCFCCLLSRKSSGIGKYVEQIIGFFKPLTDGIFFPVCIDRDIMNCLNACRVIVQNNDLFLIPGNFFI